MRAKARLKKLQETRKEKRIGKDNTTKLEGLKQQRVDMRAKCLKLLGGKCVRCGLTDPDLLQIDHLAPVGKYRAGEWHKYVLILNGYADKYQILCPNCSVRKRKEVNTGELFNEKQAYEAWRSQKYERPF